MKPTGEVKPNTIRVMRGNGAIEAVAFALFVCLSIFGILYCLVKDRVEFTIHSSQSGTPVLTTNVFYKQNIVAFTSEFIGDDIAEQKRLRQLWGDSIISKLKAIK